MQMVLARMIMILMNFFVMHLFGYVCQLNIVVGGSKVSHVGIDGHATLEGPIEEVARSEANEAEGLLRSLGIPVR